MPLHRQSLNTRLMHSIRTFHRTIVFTRTPLTNRFQYKDIFQIFPATLENMPFSKLQRHYPNILEFWTVPDELLNVDTEVEEMKQSYSETGTILNKQDKILSLLSLISNNLFFRYQDLTGIWGMPILKDDPGEEANSWSSKWCWPKFFFPGMPKQLQITELTKLQMATINRLPHKLYYTIEPNLDFDEKRNIIFPVTAEEILDAYYELDVNKQKIIDSAIAHIVNSMEFRLMKKTLSLLCSFTAVETMVNLEYEDLPTEKCDSCGQLKYSIARKFREFLLKYVATAEINKAKYNQYYSLRSKIVHTGRHIQSEKLFSDVPKSERDVDFLTQVEILQMGKLAIVNWLLIKHREK